MGELIPFESARPPAVMANRSSGSLAAAQAGVQASFAVIGYKGRNWRLKYRGDEELLKGENGAPLAHLDVVIVGVSPAISKQWYEKKYSEGDYSAPDCFSVDGMSPDSTSPKKQAQVCATCPRNKWGSRITDDGKKAKECQDSRRLAVVPLGDIENESFGGPMLLRLPPTTLSNFANYASFLERKGAAGCEYVATRLGFDYDVAYPKITFEALGWLNEDQAALVVGPDGHGGVCADPQIERMLQQDVTETTTEVASAEESSALDQGGPPAALRRRAEGTSVAPLPDAASSQAGSSAASEPTPPAQPASATAPAPAAPGSAKRAATAFSAAPKVTPKPAPVVAAPEPEQAEPIVAERVPAKPPTTIAEAPSDMLSAIDELLKQPAVAD